MMGNYLVRFLGGDGGASLPTYPVLRKTYGYGKVEDWICLSQFCLSTGIKKPNVSRAIKQLQGMNLIIKNDNTYPQKLRINKDYSQWRPLSKKIILSRKITNIIPIMDIDTFLEGYKKILRHIYSPKNYYQRIKTFFREYKAPKIKAQFKFNDMLALFRAIYHLGILGNERVQFWKLLLWTYFHRRELLPLSVTLAVYGYHFRKVSKLHVL